MLIVLTHEHKVAIYDFCTSLVHHDKADKGLGNHQLWERHFGPNAILQEYYKTRVEEDEGPLVKVTLKLVLLWDQYTPVR